MIKVILLDVDHTVSNAFWRDYMIPAADWDAYHAASVDDKPIPEIVDMLNLLADYYTIVGITSRDEKWRKLTMDWLIKWDVPMNNLLMRPAGDFRRAPELKVALALQAFGDKLNERVAFILDDREDVIEAFKALSITALQVHAKRDQPR